MSNRLRQQLESGSVVLSTVITLDSPSVAEIFAGAGFDCLWVDAEHSALSLGDTLSLLQAMNGTGASSIVRVAWNDPVLIKRVLDLGPDGIMVPLVTTKEEAHQAVRACRYPPDGIRGAGVGRAQKYGLELSEYLATANDEIVVVVQIEHIDAVRNVESILSVPGIGMLFVGPLDLSGSMGLLGQVGHPEVQKAISQVLSACQSAGMPVGIYSGSAEAAREHAARGFQFVALGIDVVFLANAAKQTVEAARA